MQDERQNLPSASSWARYEKCAGSYQLSLAAKELGQEAHMGGEAAERGTRIHAWLAGIPDEDGNEIKLSESEQITADFIQERAQGEAKRIFGDEPVRQLNEKRLWLSLHGKRMLSGQFDRVIHTPGLALVQDFKTGFSEPDPIEQNAQLKVLAVLVGLALPSVQEIVTQLVSGPYGVFERRWSIKELAEAYADICKTLAAIHAPHAPFNPSQETCRYCPAINICQAVKDLVLPVAELQHSALPDGKRAAKLLDEIELLQNHIEEIRAYYKKRLEQDPQYAIPGWGLLPGAPKRSVSDWVAARAKLEEFINANVLDGLATFSIPGVEKLLGEAIGVKGPKLKEQLKFVLGDLLELNYPEPGLKRLKGEPKLSVLTT